MAKLVIYGREYYNRDNILQRVDDVPLAKGGHKLLDIGGANGTSLWRASRRCSNAS